MGTFEKIKIALMSVADIRNYGDILFSLIARQEILKYLPNAEFKFFTPTDYCIEGEIFQAYTRELLDEFSPDAIIVLGGEVIHRYDETVWNQMYRNIKSSIVSGKASNIIFDWLDYPCYKVWFSVGALTLPVPENNYISIEELSHLHTIAVRGVLSKKILEQDYFTYNPHIEIVPDIGWLFPRLVTSYGQLLSQINYKHDLSLKENEYIVFNVNHTSINTETLLFVINYLDKYTSSKGITIIVMPIIESYNDLEILSQYIHTSNLVLLPDLSLEEKITILNQAKFYVGSSLHCAITTLASGKNAGIIHNTGLTKLQDLFGHMMKTKLLAFDWYQLPELLCNLEKDVEKSHYIYIQYMQKKLDEQISILSQKILCNAIEKKEKVVMKRICLFAGYNHDKRIHDYVVHYLKELSLYADIYYLADGELLAGELDKISPYVQGQWVEKHGEYDFGSYSRLAQQYVGWDTIEHYDELLLVNDSCLCVNSFKSVFQKMNKLNCDMWGLLFTDEQNIHKSIRINGVIDREIAQTFSGAFCLGTYFIAVRNPFLSSSIFQDFLDQVTTLKLKDRNEVCEIYEYGLTKLALKNHLNIASFSDVIYRYSTTYMNEAFMLIKAGFPLLKVKIFTGNIGHVTTPLEKAKSVESDCQFSFVHYIEDIQRSNQVKAQKNVPSIQSFKEKIYPYTPVIVKGTYHFVTHPLKFFVRNILPPKIQEFVYRRREIYDFWLQARKDKKLRFSFMLRPLYNGYYPIHIRDYNKIQEERVSKIAQTDELIIFFNISRSIISGGMLSIDRFVEHSQRAFPDATIIQSGLPLKNAVIDNPFFKHSSPLIDFETIKQNFSPKKLLLNIPECFLPDFIHELSNEDKLWLLSISDLRINILNQSDELMPPSYYIEEARLLSGNKLTITAAHVRYCTDEKSEKYNVPIYLLTPFLPNFYQVPFEKKKKVIALSPDDHPYKEKVIKLLNRELPDYELIIIQNMKLEDYKILISEALFSITFGEGYDGYFIEPALSNSLSFAVYNDTFFPEDLKRVQTLYNDWDDLLANIICDIKMFESDQTKYDQASLELREEVSKFTNDELSYQNLSDWYQRFLQQ